MKKLLSVSLIIMMILGILGITPNALSSELIKNGDFETGNSTYFEQYAGNATGVVGKEYAHSGEYGLLLKDRSGPYGTYSQDIKPVLEEYGAGSYTASFWIKAGDNKDLGAKGYLVINVTFDDGTNKPVYFVSPTIQLSKKWQKCTFSGLIPFNEAIGIKSAIIYPQFFEGDHAPDLIIDDISLKKDKDLDEFGGTDVSGEQRSDTTSFGAIRWDAWYSHDGVNNSIISQVERSLSPMQFHWRAPFFASVTDDNKIIIPEFTQDVFDREMEYAMYAGIDYFAYVWYKDNMKSAREFHTQSKYRDNVKMCACFDGNAINQAYARKEMKTLLKQSYYMTVLDGRPLMFYFASNNNLENIMNDVVYYRQLAEDIGVKEPFAVILNLSASAAKYSGADAGGSYAIGGSSSYKDLTVAAENLWSSYLNNKFQFVPPVTAGWQPEPRYINPVSWTSVSNGNWAQYATERELTEHIAYSLSYMQHESVMPYTKANTVLMYAWNEHDEGGWICPTIAVDSNGKQLFNENGTPKINEKRINAVKAAIDFYKAGKRVRVQVGGKINSSLETSAVAQINDYDKLINSTVFNGTPWTERVSVSVTTPAPTQKPTPTPTLAPTTTPDASTASPDGDILTPSPEGGTTVTSTPDISQKPIGENEKGNALPIIITACCVVLVAGGITVYVIKKRKK